MLGVGVVIALVMLGRDLGTALVLFAILLAMLWVVGAPGRIFTFMLTAIGVVAIGIASTSSERLQRITNFADPFKDFHNAGWQPAHGLSPSPAEGHLRRGLGASRRSGAICQAHTDFIFAVLGEEARADRRCSSSCSSSRSRTPRSGSPSTPRTPSSGT